MYILISPSHGQTSNAVLLFPARMRSKRTRRKQVYSRSGGAILDPENPGIIFDKSNIYALSRLISRI